MLTTAPQKSLDRSLGIGSDSSLPVSLVIEDSTKVTYHQCQWQSFEMMCLTSSLTDNVKDTKDQTTLGPHGQVRALSVARDRINLGGIIKQLPHLGWRANDGRGGIGDESKGNQDAIEDESVGVVGDQSGSHATREDVNGNTEGNEETSCNSVHAGKVRNGSGTPQNKHSYKKKSNLVGARLAGRWRLTGNDNVGRKGKKQKHKVCNSAPSSLDDFKIGMTKGSVLLKLAGDHGKEKDLDGSAGSVPPRTADTKLVSAHSEHHTTTNESCALTR